MPRLLLREFNNRNAETGSAARRDRYYRRGDVVNIYVDGGIKGTKVIDPSGNPWPGWLFIDTDTPMGSPMFDLLLAEGWQPIRIDGVTDWTPRARRALTLDLSTVTFVNRKAFLIHDQIVSITKVRARSRTEDIVSTEDRGTILRIPLAPN